jgi:hypothetical protein
MRRVAADLTLLRSHNLTDTDTQSQSQSQISSNSNFIRIPSLSELEARRSFDALVHSYSDDEQCDKEEKEEKEGNKGINRDKNTGKKKNGVGDGDEECYRDEDGFLSKVRYFFCFRC